jgi:hypothetical protein
MCVPLSYGCCRRVLVMEWVDGVKGPWIEDGRRLLTIGLQCSVTQVLDTGFLHAGEMAAPSHTQSRMRTRSTQQQRWRNA